jgi:nicotinate-nucleotide--dimethylbenzimidazole phosphoribosyltransferase
VLEPGITMQREPPQDLPQGDAGSAAAVRERAASVLRPAGAFGRLDEVAAWLAAWQRTSQPRVSAPACVVFAADHGATARGVSAYPASVTVEMVRALRAGVATVAVLARDVGVRLDVVDVGVGRPTGDISVAAALSAERFAECWAAGTAAVDALETDLLVLGEMGIATPRRPPR